MLLFLSHSYQDVFELPLERLILVLDAIEKLMMCSLSFIHVQVYPVHVHVRSYMARDVLGSTNPFCVMVLGDIHM